jgi:hypothetical protein
MRSTIYRTKYFTQELTHNCTSDSLDKFAIVLSNTHVSLNPYQIEAAFFPFFNPFARREQFCLMKGSLKNNRGRASSFY